MQALNLWGCLLGKPHPKPPSYAMAEQQNFLHIVVAYQTYAITS